MSTSRERGWSHLAARAALAGLILGATSLAVGMFVMEPISNRSSADDSPSSVAAIDLVVIGLAMIVAFAVLWAGLALWNRAIARRQVLSWRGACRGLGC
jgi:hypothetical protein